MFRSRFFNIFSVMVIGILLGSGINEIEGRKCVCTSKACKESGAKTCRTRYSCYTELIYNGEAKPTSVRTTRGCTEGATPLLCETKSWKSSDENNPSGISSLELLGRVAWPRLTCCDTHDYCNAADEDFEPTPSPDDAKLKNTTDDIEIDRNYGYVDDRRNANVPPNKVQQSVQPIHFAALVLAIAALISVFAACYVVTRFLNASGGGLPRIIGSSAYGNRLDF